MPPPAAPTDLVLTQVAEREGHGTLEWDHAGPAKFEVLYRRPYDVAWRTLHLANAASFGAGPYELEVPLTDDIDYTVVAINAGGEASAKPAHVTLVGEVQGIWFLPFKNGQIVNADRAWIGGTSPGLSAERDGELIVIPSRDDEVNVTSGKVRLYKGAAVGQLINRFGVTSDEWLGRLERLITHQRNYRWIWLASHRWMFKCELLTGPSLAPITAGGRAYGVDVGIRQLPNRHGV